MAVMLTRKSELCLSHTFQQWARQFAYHAHHRLGLSQSAVPQASNRNLANNESRHALVTLMHRDPPIFHFRPKICFHLKNQHGNLGSACSG
jgi:hypothetical protein